MAITYDQAMEQFEGIFDGRPISGWTRIFETGEYPIEAYRIFNTLEAAELVAAGDEGEYDVYPGAIISVINDTEHPENNGLYHVVYNETEEQGAPLYRLEKYYNASTVDELISQVGGSTAFFDVDNSSVGKRLVYFTGTDSSVNGHSDSSLYFTPFIAYDPTDGTLFSPTVAQASDERLKNIIEQINVDLDTLDDIQKIRFTWKNEENGKVNIGVVAQSVEKVFPELVIENPDTGYKNVNYEGLSVVALAAVDKLHAEVKNLEERLYQLENRMYNI